MGVHLPKQQPTPLSLFLPPKHPKCGQAMRIRPTVRNGSSLLHTHTRLACLPGDVPPLLPSEPIITTACCCCCAACCCCCCACSSVDRPPMAGCCAGPPGEVDKVAEGCWDKPKLGDAKANAWPTCARAHTHAHNTRRLQPHMPGCRTCGPRAARGRAVRTHNKPPHQATRPGTRGGPCGQARPARAPPPTPPPTPAPTVTSSHCSWLYALALASVVMSLRAYMSSRHRFSSTTGSALTPASSSIPSACAAALTVVVRVVLPKAKWRHVGH